tara:strand:- start:84 stop:578 length:495 start_codon:yes stop_codon:yes gene_type:complete
MPINFKAPLSSSVANATFLDKTIPDTMAATLTLDDSDIVSGSTIGNAQLSINRNTSLSFSEVTKNDGDTITVNSISGNQDHPLIGNGAPVTLNALPFGAFEIMPTGTVIYVSGGSDTNTVKLTDNRLVDYGCVLNGSATLGEYDTITLKFNILKKRYIEIGRNF